jgi:hypothetical protein
MAGRAYNLKLFQSQIFNPIALNPAPVTGAGGMRISGCQDSVVVGGYISSGDASWQFAPSGSSGNDSIVGCHYLGVTGKSASAEFFLAQLWGGSSDSQAFSATASAAGTGYSIGDTLTATGGSCTASPVFSVTQVNSGVVTQVQLITAGDCSTPPGNPVSTTGGGTGATLNITWVGYNALSGCILDSSVSVGKGQAVSGRGVTIANLGSSGTAGACAGRAPIDDLRVGDVAVDGSSDFQSAQQVSVNAGDIGHPIGHIILDGLHVTAPFQACLVISGPVQLVDAANLDCGRLHAALLGTLNSAAVTGATSVTVPLAMCGMIRNGDTIGIVLDAGGVNGSYSNKEQIFTLTSACAPGAVGTVTLPSGTPLLGSATPGTNSNAAQIYNFAFQSQPTTALTPVGSSPTVTLFNTSNYTAGDSVLLAYDNGTAVSTTIASVTSATTLTLATSTSSTSSATNLFADTSLSGSGAPIIIKGASSARLVSPVAYGNGSAVISVGPSSAASALVTDLRIENAQLHDVPPGSAAVVLNACDHCQIVGGSFYTTAGSTTSNAVTDNTAAPNWISTLALAMNSTVTTLAVASPSNFPFIKPFYILVGSEIMRVTKGFGTNTWTVARGALNTTAAAQALGATVTVAQAGTTESPVTNLDVGDYGASSCSAAFAYAPGEGNWVTNIAGCDSGVVSLSTSPGTLTYTDFAPVWRLTGSTITAALGLPSCATASTCTPIFKSFTFSLYNSTASALTINNGSGWGQTGGGNYSLVAKGLSSYYFDPNTQTARQVQQTLP